MRTNILHPEDLIIHRKISSLREIVKRSHKRGVYIGLTLVDRAFFNIEVITELKEWGLHFIVPEIKNGKVKKATQGYNKMSLQTLHYSDRKNSFGLNLSQYQRLRSIYYRKKKSSMFSTLHSQPIFVMLWRLYALNK